MVETAEVGWQSQRHWRNYLLDRGYQLRFTLIIVGISATLTSVLGWFVLSKAHEASRVVQVRAMDPSDELAHQLQAQFAHNDQRMTIALIVFGIVLCLVLAVYGIVLTHKVAGPLHKVSIYLDKIRQGRLGTINNLRRGDELIDFYQHFKDAHDALRRRTEADIALLEKAIAALGASPVAEELREAKDRKEESLK
jgi:hypothetical protein